MKFEILNVEHGFSAYVIGADGSVIVFDCGRSQQLQPSDYLEEQQIRVIRNLFIMNYDEDHIWLNSQIVGMALPSPPQGRPWAMADRRVR